MVTPPYFFYGSCNSRGHCSQSPSAAQCLHPPPQTCRHDYCNLLNSIHEAPITVMSRSTWDRIIQGTPVNQVFEQAAQVQSTREFTLEHLVLIMIDVVCGHHPATRSAFRDRPLPLIASLSAFSGRLNRLELAVTDLATKKRLDQAKEVRPRRGSEP